MDNYFTVRMTKKMMMMMAALNWVIIFLSLSPWKVLFLGAASNFELSFWNSSFGCLCSRVRTKKNVISGRSAAASLQRLLYGCEFNKFYHIIWLLNTLDRNLHAFLLINILNLEVHGQQALLRTTTTTAFGVKWQLATGGWAGWQFGEWMPSLLIHEGVMYYPI